jgi:hypothetical protein
MTRTDVLRMVKRRAVAAGLPSSTCLPYLSGDGDHGIFGERRDDRERAADRRARVAADDEALRSDGR